MLKISKKLSVKISFGLSIVFAFAILAVASVAWNYTAILFPKSELAPIPSVVAATYPEAIIAFIADIMLIKLLASVSRESIFTSENVAHIRAISWMCFAESLLFLGESIASLLIVGPERENSRILFSVFLVISFACAFMGLIVRVVKNIFEQATAIKAENDYTV